MNAMSPFPKEEFKLLMYWVTEREAIRLKKVGGMPAPWTKDPVLGKYRFCNVRRNDDTVTQWIHEKWLWPNGGTPNLWFAMVVARLVNWPATLGVLTPAVFDLMKRGRKGQPEHEVNWDPDLFVSYMHELRLEGRKVFSGAYIVSTNGRQMDKAEYLAQHVLSPLWAGRDHIVPKHGDTLAEFHSYLMQANGLGNFMAAQVVADIKYDERGPLFKAADWHTWAAPGPGSKRGLLRLLGRQHTENISDSAWTGTFSFLLPLVNAALPATTFDGNLTGQDLQNCLCEFDKYRRTQLGQGRPRSTYIPGA